MIKNSIFLAAVVGALSLAAGCAGTPPAAATPAVAATPATAQVAEKTPEKKNCNDDYATGSHIDHNHVCLSDEDEDQVHSGTEQVIDSMRRMGTQPGH